MNNLISIDITHASRVWRRCRGVTIFDIVDAHDGISYIFEPVGTRVYDMLATRIVATLLKFDDLTREGRCE